MAGEKAGRGEFAAVMIEDVWGVWKAQALASALELDVFSHVAAGKRRVGQLAAATRTTPRGIRGLLDALVAMRYLGKRGDQYNLRPPADAYLVPGAAVSLWPLVESVRAWWSDWARLTEVVRSGEPCVGAEKDPAGAERKDRLTAALFCLGRDAAPAAVKAFPPRRLAGIRNILEIGPGAGAWSLSFAKALPECRVTVRDSGRICPLARQAIATAGLENRFTFHNGDPRHEDLGAESFDLVICSYALSLLGPVEARELARRCAGALNPDGAILIAEFLPNDIRSDPPLALLYGLTLLLHTEQGDAYTLREYRTWIRDAGLHFSQTIDAGAFSPLILGTK